MTSSETTQTRIIFPSHLNDRNILFGGILLSWMDEVAYITALRYLNQNTVTVSLNKVKFFKPVRQGDIIDITGKVTKVGIVKLYIQVEIVRDSKESGEKDRIAFANFYFAATDINFNPERMQKELTANLKPVPH